MNPEEIKSTIQAIIDGLTPLAEKIQMPVEKLFEWALKENYVQAIIGIWGVLVYIVLMIFFYKACKWITKNGDSELFIFIVMIGMIVLFSTMGVVYGTVPDVIARLVNPEYHAFIDLINLIK